MISIKKTRLRRLSALLTLISYRGCLYLRDFNDQMDRPTGLHYDEIGYEQPILVLNMARTGARAAARFKPEVPSRSKLTKCPTERTTLQVITRYIGHWPQTKMD